MSTNAQLQLSSILVIRFIAKFGTPSDFLGRPQHGFSTKRVELGL